MPRGAAEGGPRTAGVPRSGPGLYGRTLRLVWQAAPVALLLYCPLAVVSGLLPTIDLWLTRSLLNVVTDTVPAAVPPAPDRHFTAMWILAAMVGVWAADVILGLYTQRLSDLLGILSQHHVRKLLLAKSASLDVGVFEHPEVHDRLNNAMEQASQIPVMLLWFGMLGQMAIGLAGTVVLLARFHWLAPVALLIAALAEGAAAARFSKSWYEMTARRAPGRRMVAYLSGLLSSRDAAKELTLFGVAPALLQRLAGHMGQFVRENNALWRSRLQTQCGLSIVSNIGVAAVGAGVVAAGLSGRAGVGDMAMYLGAACGTRAGLGAILGHFANAYQNSLLLGSLFEFIDFDPSTMAGALATPRQGEEGQPVPAPLKHGFELRAVSFGYPLADGLALRGLDLTIDAGRITAIVGLNGAGKTTLVKLLLRLYDPTEGAVLLDGVDLRDYSRQSLRGRCTAVFQDYLAYHLTVRENVGFGDIAHADDAERLRSAAARAGALGVIEGLPAGWETPLGKEFKDASDLSVGEWQRIALARALMRNAQVCILDEPTSSLDALAEREFYDTFAAVASGMTTVIVSHRFSTVRMADHIVVLEHGEVAEQGSHDELMAAGGQYAGMFRAQAGMYEGTAK